MTSHYSKQILFCQISYITYKSSIKISYFMKFLGRFTKLQKLFIFVKYNFRKAHEHMTLKIYLGFIF